MPDGTALAFTGQDAIEGQGVFVQDFVPGQDTSKTRRPLAGFDRDMTVAGFNISPDASHIVISYGERTDNLMLAEHIPGVSSLSRKAR
jgi:hypothetical protein